MFGDAVPVLHPILSQVSALVVGFLFVFSSIFMACEKEGFGDFCFAVHDRVDSLGHRFFNDPHGRHLVGIGIPVLVSGCICYMIHFLFTSVRTTVPSEIFGNRSSSLYRTWTHLTQGDYPVHTLAILFVVLPCAIKVIVPIISFYTVGSHLEGARDDPNLDGFMSAIANPAGYAAVIAMAWFMVPVARQSPILVALGWNPVQALKVHVWAGRTCIFFTVLHSLCFILIAWRTSQIRVVDIVYPRRECWKRYDWNDFERDSEWPKCYLNFFLFSGFLSFICISILSFTALYWFRRAYYNIFYISHIFFGALGVLFMVMHWGEVILYIGPGFLYYFACTSPVLIQALANRCRGGVKIRYSKLIADSGFCAEMVFAKSSQARLTDAHKSAQYVRICVPELSMVWHPFTVATTPDDPSHLRLVFRRYGKFTSDLYKRLQRAENPPTILIDSYYQGADWAAQALRHDRVLMVSGGIGVTPFMSTLRQLLVELHHNYIPGESVLRRFEFHWLCREIGLTKHILETHIIPLMNVCLKVNRARRRHRRKYMSGRAMSEVSEMNDDPEDEEQEEPDCQFDIIVHYTKGQGNADFILDQLREVKFSRSESGRSVFSNACSRHVFSPPAGSEAAEATKAARRLAVPQNADDDAMGPDGNPLIYDEKEPKEDMYFFYHKDKGVEMDPAHFSMQAHYGFAGNSPSMALFYLISCVGLWVMWKIFSEVSEVFDLIVSLNAYPLYAIFIISIAFAIPFELIRIAVTKDPLRSWVSRMSGYEIEDASHTNKHITFVKPGATAPANREMSVRTTSSGIPSGGTIYRVKELEDDDSDSDSDNDSYQSELGLEDNKLGMVVDADGENGPIDVSILSRSGKNGGPELTGSISSASPKMRHDRHHISDDKSVGVSHSVTSNMSRPFNPRHSKTRRNPGEVKLVDNDLRLGESVRISDHLAVNFSLASGRPNFDVIVSESVRKGALPAIFYCGPEPVLKRLKTAVRKQMGRFPRWKCAFYEEEFYM